MLKFTKRLPIELTDGSVYEIRTLSITGTEEFRATYELLIKELEDEAYKELNLVQAFKAMPMFRKYITDLLSLVGLNFEKVPADTLYALLYPHENADGSYERQGLLIKFIFGEVTGGSSVPKEQVDAYAKALAQLWHATQSFDEATNILADVNYEDLKVLLEERAELMKTPEEKMQERAKQRAMEARDQLVEQLHGGKKVELGEEIDINSLF